MKYLYFIELDGVKYYKTDSFWSTSIKQTYAKQYSSGDQIQLLKSYGYKFKPWLERDPEHYAENYNKYNGALLGYSVFNDNIDSNTEPLRVHYLLKLEVNENADYKYSDYKLENRNNQMDRILNINE